MINRYRVSGIVLFLLCMAALSVFPSALPAQEFRKKMYQAYLSGDMDTWERSIKSLKAQEMKLDDRYSFAMLHYGLIGYCLGRDQKQRARPYLDQVEVIAGDLLKTDPDNPAYLALRGALYGFRISYQPQKSPFLGPKALKKVNEALEKGPDCPQAWIESGNKDWWMPEIFGGSRVKALAGYENAIRLMEKDPALTNENWYYLNVNMILANWYEARGRTFDAREIYRKMVAFEPDFTWAKEKLSK